MEKINTRKILEEVKENLGKLNACKKHKFSLGGPRPIRLRTRLRCSNCGGDMDYLDAVHYMQGYVACGGKAQDVIVDWDK